MQQSLGRGQGRESEGFLDLLMRIWDSLTWTWAGSSFTVGDHPSVFTMHGTFEREG
jgi:hypothetical protein